MRLSSSVTVLLPLAGLAYAAMEPSMDNLTVTFFAANGNIDAGVPADDAEVALAARIGTRNILSGTYALLVFDSDRCNGEDVLCTMQSNLTSASGLTLLGGRMVHELVHSSSQKSAVELPVDIASADGSMRLLFNTTDRAAPANAADLLAAPWSNDLVVAGSEDKKPVRTRCRTRRGRKRCRTTSAGSSSDSASEATSIGGAFRAATWSVPGIVAMVVLAVM